MSDLTWLIAGVAVIGVSTVLARRLGVAGPLILVAIGLVASLLLPTFSVPPELILVGILPPLLYASAVRLPAVEFRRDAVPIAGLAVILVVISALALGTLFFFAIPGLDFALAVALGAILSPTDAVATSIAKKLGISPRVVTMLEGESLLNDATALVLLRSAVAASAAGFSLIGTIGAFAWGVLIAVVVGVGVGLLTLRTRRWIGDPVANTAVGFIVPFVAYLPTEHLGGSGLVAAVAAGITTSQGAARWSTPEQRVSDQLNWRTLELLLEGAVFLIMGLELRDIVSGNVVKYKGIGIAIVLALAALAIVLVVRALYVSGVVVLIARRARRMQRGRLQGFSDRLDAFDPDTSDLRDLRPPRDGPTGATPRPGFLRRFTRRTARTVVRRVAARPTSSPAATQHRVDGLRARVGRLLNDMDYYQASTLNWKDGTVIVWAGMRGVVTLAAAQTLEPDTPARELLILVAFFVALTSLMLQGLTLPWLIRMLKMPAATGDGATAEESDRLDDELREAALARLRTPGLADASGTPYPPEVLAKLADRMGAPRLESLEITTAGVIDLRIALIEAMRDHLVDVSREGSYSSATLRHALARLDADQLSIQLRRGEE
ncbi:sodium:proton antiporter [Microbacterium sp. VKM Ac-2870]|uniref:cation:proton antiporter n=1 Tax=Microbacterium sp. VKM Ac-2870 TaxID=2783825 RepID=UPI00188C83F2|nr:sodium:proton antiporter [Microbacterium sp. VKM Ac-2870]MBF4562759.1 sodium:proton antiporter [Microbacterium sp. VKM Ac-2870]